MNYALEGAVFMAGASIQWLRDEMKLISDAFDRVLRHQSEGYQRRIRGTRVHRSWRTVLGPVCPRRDFRPHPRRELNHIIRATLESIAFQTRDVLEAMQADPAFVCTPCA